MFRLPPIKIDHIKTDYRPGHSSVFKIFWTRSRIWLYFYDNARALIDMVMYNKLFRMMTPL
jgi:hypothetical protein